MNTALAALLAAAPADDPRRWQFALACALRVQHLLEDPEVVAPLRVLQAFVAGTADHAALEHAAAHAAALATRHPGSRSLDGAAHAAVSATHAVARAVAGRAQEAADYAAYAMVYSYACHAVSDPAAFAGEHAWQVEAWHACIGAP